MNPFEQYSFGSVFEHIPEELTSGFQRIDVNDSKSWLEYSDQLKSIARQGYREHEALSGLAAEGGTAGAEGLYLLSILAGCKAYRSAEAQLLQADIERFIASVQEFASDDAKAGRELLPKNL